MPPILNYNEQRKEILVGIPAEFHSALDYYAYEHGHSAGEEEVLIVLRNLCNDLRDSFKKYEENHTRTKQ